MSKGRPRRSWSHRAAASVLGLLVATCAVSGAWSQTPPPAPADSLATTAAPTNSAPTAPPSTASASTDAAPIPTFTGIRRKVQAPPPPPPTPAQVAALAELEKEAESFRKYAVDYRSAMTRIIQNHYEERRRRVIDALEKEINIEVLGLKDARAEAIRRLEQFVERYSGRNAHPESTPTAMFRLAALYEERARDEGEAGVGSASPSSLRERTRGRATGTPPGTRLAAWCRGPWGWWARAGRPGTRCCRSACRSRPGQE